MSLPKHRFPTTDVRATPDDTRPLSYHKGFVYYILSDDHRSVTRSDQSSCIFCRWDFVFLKEREKEENNQDLADVLNGINGTDVSWLCPSMISLLGTHCVWLCSGLIKSSVRYLKLIMDTTVTVCEERFMVVRREVRTRWSCLIHSAVLQLILIY